MFNRSYSWTQKYNEHPPLLRLLKSIIILSFILTAMNKHANLNIYKPNTWFVSDEDYCKSSSDASVSTKEIKEQVSILL